MPLPTHANQISDLAGLGKAVRSGVVNPFTPAVLQHVYIKLDFQHRFENATNASDARGFLRSVARASLAAERVATVHSGTVLEVQGSTIHVGIPVTAQTHSGTVLEFGTALHSIYREIFDRQGARVQGWRMTADEGPTLVVAGKGVHGDNSWVSLGTSANRPAKHLYAELDRPEAQRRLKRFHMAVRDPRNGQWRYWNLDSLPAVGTGLQGVAKAVRESDVAIDYAVGRPEVMADAAPVAPAGSPESPSAEKPDTHFGWVLRADLDGFTHRVEECFADQFELQRLARSFYEIMDSAAEFIHQGTDESLIQLPWAGDNFTAAAVFPTHHAYERALPKRLVELALDYEKENSNVAEDGGFGGWAYGVAGGEPHGNAGGNVYVAGIEVDGRRFLVGAGEGFGRSTQAFGDINPHAGEVVVFEPDWTRLSESYQSCFSTATTHRDEQSTLFKLAKIRDLVGVQARKAAEAAKVVVTMPRQRQSTVSTRPYFR